MKVLNCFACGLIAAAVIGCGVVVEKGTKTLEQEETFPLVATPSRDFYESRVDEAAEYFSIKRGDSFTRVVIAIMDKMKALKND